MSASPSQVVLAITAVMTFHTMLYEEHSTSKYVTFCVACFAYAFVLWRMESKFESEKLDREIANLEAISKRLDLEIKNAEKNMLAREKKPAGDS